LRKQLALALDAHLLLARADGLGEDAGLLGLDLFAFGKEVVQLRVGGLENGDVAVVGMPDPVDELRELAVERVAGIDDFAPANRYGGNAVEESPRRMVAIGEELLVEHRNLQYRRLQAGDKGLDAFRHALVAEDEVEQIGDDVQRDGLDGPHVARGRAIACQAHQVGMGAVRGECRRRLQCIQRIEQGKACGSGVGVGRGAGRGGSGPYQAFQRARDPGGLGGCGGRIHEGEIAVTALEARKDVGVDQRFVGGAIDLGQLRLQVSSQHRQEQYALAGFRKYIGAGPVDAAEQRRQAERGVAALHGVAQGQIGYAAVKRAGFLAAGGAYSAEDLACGELHGHVVVAEDVQVFAESGTRFRAG
jgi:hypothetical protein